MDAQVGHEHGFTSMNMDSQVAGAGTLFGVGIFPCVCTHGLVLVLTGHHKNPHTNKKKDRHAREGGCFFSLSAY